MILHGVPVLHFTYPLLQGWMLRFYPSTIPPRQKKRPYLYMKTLPRFVLQHIHTIWELIHCVEKQKSLTVTLNFVLRARKKMASRMTTYHNFLTSIPPNIILTLKSFINVYMFKIWKTSSKF